MRDRRTRIFALICIVVVVAACSPRPRVKVTPPPKATAPRTAAPAPVPVPRDGAYVVVAGDTLYGIAFRHGLDYRELAARNGIAAPYTIYPGQRLRIGDPPRMAAGADAGATVGPARTRPASSTGIVASTRTPPTASTPAATDPTRPAPARTGPPSSTQTAATATPTTAASTTSASATTTQPTAATAPATPSATPALPNGPLRWQWPTAGRVVGSFLAGDPGRQGINIAGSTGQAVQAAADGVVVYSGSGLIGYGELVIVKHSDVLLSAYGHNRKRLVEEGQAVKAGQQIAEMGRSGASRDMLHFEIRRNGKPIDPLTLLPKR